MTEKRCTTCGHSDFPHPFRHPITYVADSFTTNEGREYMTSGQFWTSISDIPIGATFVPDFDDLVHPMRKTRYRKVDADTYEDVSDGELISDESFRNWWNWVQRFVEVTHEIRDDDE